MNRGITGALLSLEALDERMTAELGGSLGEADRADRARALRVWYDDILRTLGPSASPYRVYDEVAAPLLSGLGFELLAAGKRDDTLHGVVTAGSTPVAAFVVTAWGRDPGTAWRDTIRHGIAQGVRWCFCISGQALRVVDTARTYSRRFVEFDLRATFADDRSFAVFWGLLRADALRPTPENAVSVLNRAIALSDRHRVEVRTVLQHGVEAALLHLVHAFRSAARRRRRGAAEQPDAAVDESLVVIYRILFLLFAEARGLVPAWHPVFRDGYTIESLRDPLERLSPPPGLWLSLQAISRLAHRGCHAGSLRVPAFNGRLFSPSHAPLADSLPLDDGAVREAMLALTTRAGPGGRRRIAYGDLGVEQLGGVYERLLDFTASPPAGAARPTLVRVERRRATGSFYTPRSLTEYVVRRALAPLVRDTTPEGILALRVLDPAMGSGAFLVAACRYLASAYEAAVLREGGVSADDITDAERAQFRRTIAQQCLFGVDLNPMAVQLARLSLWLATLAADRPLTFLDHRLRTGNSLVGAGPNDVVRQPPPGRSSRRATPVPLFATMDLADALQTAVAVRTAIATEPGDTIDQVRAKERALADLSTESSTLARWRRVADLWCSGWFRDTARRDVLRKAFGALAAELMGAARALPDALADPLLNDADRTSAEHRFFHWQVEFPELFFDAQGRPLGNAGFDAIVGNPPWEMLRGDRGPADARAEAHLAGERICDFTRTSGIYSLQGSGHANLYQLFLERGLSLLRRGGRLGVVLPSGFGTDQGCAALRRAVLDGTAVDGLAGFENRDGVFPIHRGLKFLILTATLGGQTHTVPCRFGMRRAEHLESWPDTGSPPEALPVPRRLIERLGGPLLAIPDLRSAVDVEICAAIAATIPPLGEADGWAIAFGRELNATEDRDHFVEDGRGLPVIDGKHVRPFLVDLSAARRRISPRAAERLLGARRSFDRPRLAYRDVASPTNRTTLIAAIVPAGVVTTHTLFCVRDNLPADTMHFLCGVFNSYVANYLVRLQVGTHVSASLVERLPVPKPARNSIAFATVARLARRLSTASADETSEARLQAEAACLYGLTRVQFRHVLDGFPLVPAAARDAAWRVFCDIVT